jgi:tetratricopeptide (TPR) repeat protein
MNFSHFFIYYLLLFTGILIIFSIFVNEKPKEVLFFILLGSFLILLVPIIDFIISKGEGFKLSYIFEKPLQNFLTGFNPFAKSLNISFGQKIVFLCGAIGGGIIIFWKTKNVFKAIFFPIILYLWTFFTGLIPFIISYLLGSNFSEIFKTGGIFVSDTQKFSLLFFVILQINLFLIYILEKGSFKFLIEYEFLRDFIIFSTPLFSGILVFNYFLKDLYISIFTNKFDYFIFPGFLFISLYISLSKKFLYEEELQKFFISSVLLLFFSMTFGYVSFYLILLIVFLIYISKEINIKFYIIFSPLILAFSSSSIISHTKSFLLFKMEFCLFLLIFSLLIYLIEKENKKLWLLFSFFFYFLPFIFYPFFHFLLISLIFFILSLILFKFFFPFRNYPSLLYFALIISLTLPFCFKKEDYTKKISIFNFYFSQKKFKEAIKYIPEEISFYNFKAISYFKLSKYDSANFYFEKYLEKEPLDEEIYLYFVFSLINSGKIMDAYKMNKKAFFLFSSKPEIILQKGIIFFHLNFLDEAEKLFKKAIQMGYEGGVAYSYLTIIYLRKKDFKKSKIYFEKANQLEPDFLKKLLLNL